MLYDDIKKIIVPSICDDKNIRINYLKRLEKGNFTRDENPQNHFCTYFLPYSKSDKKFFLIHHKNSGLWLSPGGHIKKGEGLLDTLNREINEELGLKKFFKKEPSPFLLTITHIENKTHTCKIHYDIWYLLLTDGNNFDLDLKEFYDTKWLTINEAKKIVTNPQNLKALEKIRKKY